MSESQTVSMFVGVCTYSSMAKRRKHTVLGPTGSPGAYQVERTSESSAACARTATVLTERVAHGVSFERTLSNTVVTSLVLGDAMNIHCA